MFFEKDNIINFTGNMHYADPNALTGIPCKPGLAYINMVSEDKNAKHLYQVIAVPFENKSNKKSDVYGWINAEDIGTINNPVEVAIDKLAYLKIINSPEYWKGIIAENRFKYLDLLIIKAAKKITQFKTRQLTVEKAINNLITAEVITSPEYWSKLLMYNNITALLIALGGSVNLPSVYNEQRENDLRQKVVQTAQSFLGYNEWDGSHLQILSIYNNFGNLPRSYALNSTDSWCATFVSVVGILCGIADTIIPRECSCEHQINLFKQLGAWVEDDAYVPRSADIIYYNWDDDWQYEYTDQQGWADHVGIVTQVNLDEGTMLIIEGNYQDQVKYRTLDINGRFIRGFAVPKY